MLRALFKKPEVPKGVVEIDCSGSRVWLLEEFAEPLSKKYDLSDPAKLAKQYPSGLGGRGELAKLTVQLNDAEQQIVLRPYLRGGLLGPILNSRYMDPYRSLRELCLYLEAKRRNLTALGAIGAIAQPAGVGYRHGLLSIFVDSMIDVQTLLLETPFASSLQHVFRDIGSEIRSIHDAGFYHSDLNIKNILVHRSMLVPNDQASESGDSASSHDSDTAVAKVMIIDFDRGYFSQQLSQGARENNLLRLLRSYRKFQKKFASRFADKATPNEQNLILRWVHEGYFGFESAVGQEFWERAKKSLKSSLRFKFSQWRTVQQ